MLFVSGASLLVLAAIVLMGARRAPELPFTKRATAIHTNEYGERLYILSGDPLAEATKIEKELEAGGYVGSGVPFRVTREIDVENLSGRRVQGRILPPRAYRAHGAATPDQAREEMFIDHHARDRQVFVVRVSDPPNRFTNAWWEVRRWLQ